jgi:hypothetical protein
MLRPKITTLWQTHKKSKATLVCPTASKKTESLSVPVANPKQSVAGERPEGVTSGLSQARRLRAPQRVGLERFVVTDPGVDVSRHPLVAKALRSRRFQFALILPNQIIFWLVIISGIFGTLTPGLNFGTAITWYIWFFVIFLMMVAVGRAGQPQAGMLDDATLLERVAGELREAIGVRGRPLATLLERWERALPQYAVGHLERVERIEEAIARFPRLALAGAAYRGMGVPQCIAQGRAAASQILADLSPAAGPVAA